MLKLLAFFRPSWPVWLTLAVGLTLTALATVRTHSDVASENRQILATIGAEIAQKIETRLHAQALVLRDAAAFLRVSGELDRTHWRDYITQAKIHLNLPGVQGLGFARLIPTNRLAEHVRDIRDEGFPDYRVWPEGERPVYTTIVYLEPFAGRNLRAFGYDMFTEPVRRAAMERARDQDVAALSGKVRLVQETETDVQAGTLMFVPAYRPGVPTATVDQRRAALLGWVYSPYRMNDLMHGILGSWNRDGDKRIRLAIYDGDRSTPEALLYDSQAADHQRPATAYANVLRIPIDFNGQHWTLDFSQFRPSAFSLDDLRVSLVAGSGIAISLLLAALVGTFARMRTHAQQLATELKFRQRAEQSLRTADRNYRSLVDNLRAGVVVHAPDTGIRFSNPMASQLLGLTAQQMQGIVAIDPAWHFIREDGTPMPPQEYPVNRVAASGSALCDLILGICTPTCEDPTWVQCEGHPIRDDQGQVQQIVVTFFDITPRQRAVDALRRSEALLNEMGRMARVGGWQLDLATGKQVWTEAVYLIHEVDTTFEPNLDNAIGFYPPSAAPIVKQAVERAANLGESFDLEVEFVTAKGNHRWIHTIGRAVQERGRTVALTGVFQDITARKEAEVELARYRDHLETLVQSRTQALNEQLVRVREQDHLLIRQSRLAAMGEMITNIAHQWRQPLNALALVLGNIQDAEQHQELTPEYLTRKMADARRLIDKMSTTISDFRDFFRPDKAPETFPVSKPTGAALALVEASLRAHDITVTTDIREDVCSAGISNEYSQVILNLLDNAKDAIIARHLGGGQILVQVDRDGDQARVRISDNGGGITDEMLPRIFEPYFSTKPGGTGIGLYMSKMIIENSMGGTITACTLESGAEFTVSTPLVDPGL
jgi:signal transduction histidine kinase/CHASE1-domain containing sensor protein